MKWLTTDVSILRLRMNIQAHTISSNKAHRCAISNDIDLPKRGAFDTQMGIDHNSFLMHLVWQQVGYTLRERIHADSSGPQHKVGWNSVTFGRTVLVADCVAHTVLGNSTDSVLW